MDHALESRDDHRASLAPATLPNLSLATDPRGGSAPTHTRRERPFSL